MMASSPFPMQFDSEICLYMSTVDINPAEIGAKMHSYSLLKRYNGLARASKQAYILEGNMSILSFPDIFLVLPINLSLLQFATMDTKNSPGANELKNGCDRTEYYFRAGLETVRDLVRLSVRNDQLARGHVTTTPYCACASQEHFRVNFQTFRFH